MNRREFGGLVTLGVAACARRAKEEQGPEPAARPDVVRVASVKTAVDGRLLPELIARFERESQYAIELSTGIEVYDFAREGKVDLVISHYGHKDAEQFVLDGIGEWPRTVFANQMALLGPPNDPANVRGLTDLGEAFARIASTKSLYLVNDIDGVRYLTEILWHAAGRPDRAGWLVDAQASKDAAVEQAAQRCGYTLWGLTPFLRLAGAKQVALEPLVLADPLLERMMVSIIVKPGGIRRINTSGALAFQTYLLSPATQAAIRTIHYPDQAVTWTPAGRHNRTAVLPAS